MTEMVTQALLDRLAETGRSRQHMFYLTLAVAAALVYFVAYAPPPDEVMPADPDDPRSAVKAHLEEIEPILKLSDYLLQEPALLRRYTDVLGEFAALEDAASQAITAVEVEDPRWLALDPHDRNLARRIEDSTSILIHEIDTYLGDNLRQLPVHNLEKYAKSLVHQEIIYDTQSALAQLKASLRVAQGLDAPVQEPRSWPASLHLLDHARAQGLDDLVAVLEAARKVPITTIAETADWFETFCLAQGVELAACTPGALAQVPSEGRWIASAGGQTIDTTVEIVEYERKEVGTDVLGFGLPIALFLKALPLTLLVTSCLYAMQARSHLLLRHEVARRLGGEKILLFDAPSLFHGLDLALGPQPLTRPAIHTWLLFLFMQAGHAAPVAAQGLAAYYAFRRWELGQWPIAWAVVSGLCTVITAIALAAVFRQTLGELAGRVRGAAPAATESELA